MGKNKFDLLVKEDVAATISKQYYTAYNDNSFQNVPSLSQAFASHPLYQIVSVSAIS